MSAEKPGSAEASGAPKDPAGGPSASQRGVGVSSSSVSAAASASESSQLKRDADKFIEPLLSL